MSTARESGKESKHTVNDEPHKEDAENIRHGDNQSIFHTIFPSLSIGLHIAACHAGVTVALAKTQNALVQACIWVLESNFCL